MKIIERIKSDLRVAEVSDERELGDGFWVYLKSGWNNGSAEEHIIHEASPSACLKRFYEIDDCNCDDCKKWGGGLNEQGNRNKRR